MNDIREPLYKSHFILQKYYTKLQKVTRFICKDEKLSNFYDYKEFTL